MSKGNMLLGHARGKVGSLVFARVNGQQVTRARAEVVKNPQTDAQVVQRLLMNTCAQAYSRMAAICDHSFEGIKNGQDSMSYFMKRNLNELRSILADQGSLDTDEILVVPIGQSFVATNEFVISKGSLPVVNTTSVANNGVGFKAPQGTYKSLLDYYGLQRGDQLTICAFVGTSQSDIAFKYARIILDPKNEDGTDAPITSNMLDGTSINKPNPKNEINDFTFQSAGDTIMANPGVSTINGALIASRKAEDGSWLRSNSKMVGSAVVSYGMTVEEALAAFRSGAVELVNPKFLNNANAKVAEPASNEVTITLTKNPAAGGNVSGGGVKTKGSSVTITATPASDYTFSGWYKGDTLVSSQASYTFTANATQTLEARFAADESSGD